jgi:hypothetical protein
LHRLFVEATLTTEIRERAHAVFKAGTTHLNCCISSSDVIATNREIAMAQCALHLRVLQQCDIRESFSSRSTTQLPQFHELECMLRQCALRASGVLTSGLTGLPKGHNWHTPEIGLNPRLALVRVFFDCLQLGLCPGKLHRSLKRPRRALAKSALVSEFFAVRCGNGFTHPSHSLLRDLLKESAIVSKINFHACGDGSYNIRHDVNLHI